MKTVIVCSCNRPDIVLKVYLLPAWHIRPVFTAKDIGKAFAVMKDGFYMVRHLDRDLVLSWPGQYRLARKEEYSGAEDLTIGEEERDERKRKACFER